MLNKINKILTILIVLVAISFITYIIFLYIKTPVNKNEYPISITELLDETKEWTNYIKDNTPTKMIVYVNHMDSSETPQVFTDPNQIKEVLDILLNMKATSLADKFNNSSTKIIYYFEDESNKNMSFTFQEGLYKTSSARYYVDSLEELNNLSYINLYD